MKTKVQQNPQHKCILIRNTNNPMNLLHSSHVNLLTNMTAGTPFPGQALWVGLACCHEQLGKSTDMKKSIKQIEAYQNQRRSRFKTSMCKQKMANKNTLINLLTSPHEDLFSKMKAGTPFPGQALWVGLAHKKTRKP